MMTTEETLAGLLEPAEFERFVQARDNYEPFLATGRPDRTLEYFTIDDFADLVNQTNLWTPDRLEVHLDAQKVPPHNFFSQLPLTNGVRYRLENAQLQELLDLGASIVLNDIDSMRPGLKRLRTMIANFTGGRVENNLYYSQRGHQAFSVHFDKHDVYAFQIAGEKRWQIYEQICRHPIHHAAFLGGTPQQHEQRKGLVAMDVTLRPGDFLYLPAGRYHQAICTESVSVHLSFGSSEMIGLNVLSQLFEAAVYEDFFRVPIVRALPTGDQRMRGYLKLLAEHIGQLMQEEEFVQMIQSSLDSFAYPSDDVAVNKEWGVLTPFP